MAVNELSQQDRQAIVEQPVTGMKGRTRREDIERPLTAPGVPKEVVQIIDVSGSNGEPAGPDAPTTKQELLEIAVPLVVRKLAGDDAEAAKEAADGVSTGKGAKGGVRTFAADEPEEFEGWDKKEAEFEDARDLGDMSEADSQEKLHRAFRGGRTFLMPAIRAMEKAYHAEFPAGDRALEMIIWTDGQASDEAKVEKWVADMAGPKCAIGVVIVGYDQPGDDRHAKTVRSYEKLAKDNAHLSLVVLTGVSDPEEVALDVQLMAA
jgi:hypothetical protein